MSEEIVVLVTAGSEDEAKNIAHKIVRDELVACVNIVPSIQSVFRWEGSVTEEQESLLILKTKTEVLETLEAVIKAHHSYNVPEIIAIPIQAGSSEYLSWMRAAVKSQRSQEPS